MRRRSSLDPCGPCARRFSGPGSASRRCSSGFRRSSPRSCLREATGFFGSRAAGRARFCSCPACRFGFRHAAASLASGGAVIVANHESSGRHPRAPGEPSHPGALPRQAPDLLGPGARLVHPRGGVHSRGPWRSPARRTPRSKRPWRGCRADDRWSMFPEETRTRTGELSRSRRARRCSALPLRASDSSRRDRGTRQCSLGTRCFRRRGPRRRRHRRTDRGRGPLPRRRTRQADRRGEERGALILRDEVPARALSR